MNDFCRSLETLRGLLGGLSIDHQLNDTEIAYLQGWLEMHCNLELRPPFNEVFWLVQRILKDDVIDPDEREELLEFCQVFSDPLSYSAQCVRDSVRRLHGMLAGLVADSVLSNEEVLDLADWLENHRACGSIGRLMMCGS